MGVFPRRVRVHDEVQLAGKVVDDGELLGQEESNVGQSQGIGLGRPAQPALDVAHRVVAEISREPAGEAKLRSDLRGAESLEGGVDELEGIVDPALLDRYAASLH